MTQTDQLSTLMEPESPLIQNLVDFGGLVNTKQRVNQRVEACRFTVQTIWVHGPGNDWLWVCFLFVKIRLSRAGGILVLIKLFSSG